MRLTPFDLTTIGADGSGMASATVKQLDEAIDRTSVPRHRDLLKVVKEHFVAELIDNDIERTMATLIHNPRYRSYGLGPDGARIPTEMDTDAQVRDWYNRLFETGSDIRGLEIDIIVVDDDSVAMHCTHYNPFPMLLAHHPEAAEHVDATRKGFSAKATSGFAPFDGLLMAGEIQYYDLGVGLGEIVYVD
jgi:hypothetical protein